LKKLILIVFKLNFSSTYKCLNEIDKNLNEKVEVPKKNQIFVTKKENSNLPPFKRDALANINNNNSLNNLDLNLVDKQMKKYVFLFLSKNEDIDETSASNHNSNFIANLLEKNKYEPSK